MTRARSLVLALDIPICAALVAAGLILATRGYASASDIDLHGRTLLNLAGLLKFSDFISAYPPIPYLVGTIVNFLFPASGTTGLTVTSSVAAAALSASWLVSFRKSGLSVPEALAACAALSLNPVFIRAATEGIGFVFLHIGLWIALLGMFSLRRGERVNDILLVSGGLMIAAFAHPFGMVLVFACLPFLALVMPPDRLRMATGPMYLVLFFPVIFAVISFMYVNWVFEGNPIAFLWTASRESAGLGAAPTGAPGQSASQVLLAILGIVAVAPVMVTYYVTSRGLAPIRYAVVAVLLILFSSAVLAYVLDLFPSASLVASLGVTGAAVCVARWPRSALNRLELLLMVAGILGGFMVVVADQSSESVRWRAAVRQRPVAPPDPELAAVAKSLAGKRNILFDADAAPAVVALRGNATGIWNSATDQFRFATIRGRTDADVIVVRTREAANGADRVGRAFPQLYEDGMSGYRLRHDGSRWRVYEAMTESGR